MKKIAMTLACAFVAAGMLTGCGSSVDENKTPEEIRHVLCLVDELTDEAARHLRQRIQDGT